MAREMLRLAIFFSSAIWPDVIYRVLRHALEQPVKVVSSARDCGFQPLIAESLDGLHKLQMLSKKRLTACFHACSPVSVTGGQSIFFGMVAHAGIGVPCTAPEKNLIHAST